MEEGTSKAIPIRRSRTGARALTVRTGRWSDGITAGVRYVLAPPRQLWLVSLGGTALALRGVRAAWSLMISEGEGVESRLRRALDRRSAAATSS
jgi:hypothetical protein